MGGPLAIFCSTFLNMKYKKRERERACPLVLLVQIFSREVKSSEAKETGESMVEESTKAERHGISEILY
jgi:hypothetical protein